MKLNGQYGVYEVDPVAFNENGAFGVIHRCVSPNNYVIKSYRWPLTDRRKIDQLMRVQSIGRDVLVARRQRPGVTPEASINWPIDHVRNDRGEVTAVVLPAIPNDFWALPAVPRIFSWMYLWRGDPPPAATRVPALIRLAELFNYLDHYGLVHGDMSENNVVIAYGDRPGAYLIDCDGLQSVRHPEFLDSLGTPGW